jgi:hypothetical protein
MNERHLRNVIRQMLFENEAELGPVSVEDTISSPSGGGGGDYGSGPRGALLKVFWKPFADVGKAAKLTAKDVLNGMRLAFDTALTLSPKELANAKSKYDKRRAAIEAEWRPLLQSSYSAIADSDLGLVTLTLAPHLFFSAVIAKGITQGPSEIAGFLGSAGWFPDAWLKEIDKEMTNSKFYSDEEWTRLRSGMSGKRKTSSSSDSEETGKVSVSQALKSFFFSEKKNESLHDLVDSLILEIESKPNTQGPKIQLNLPPQSLGGSAAKLTEEFISSKRDQADELIKQAAEKIVPIKNIIENAKNYDDLSKLASLSSSDSSGLEAVKKEIEVMNKKLDDEKVRLDNDKEVKKAVEKAYNKGKEKGDIKEDVTFDAYKAASAEQALTAFKKRNFMSLRSAFSESLQAMSGKISEQIRQEILKDTSPGGKTVEIPPSLLESGTKASTDFKKILESISSGVLGRAGSGS